MERLKMREIGEIDEIDEIEKIDEIGRFDKPIPCGLCAFMVSFAVKKIAEYRLGILYFYGAKSKNPTTRFKTEDRIFQTG